MLRFSTKIIRTATAALLMSTSLASSEPNELRTAYFGETHMHTSFSLDAYLGGNRLTPSDSLRYAKGETVSVNGIQRALPRPLDFAAVSDHAEYLGEMYSTMYVGAPGHDDELLVELRTMTEMEDRLKWFLKYVISSNRSLTPSHPPFFAGKETVESAWKIIIDAANTHNDPGNFTAFIAFEWSGAPQGGNLHRNVIYRDTNVPNLPVSYIDVNREDGLWDWMEQNEAMGMHALAIPHNSNASKGMMFPSTNAAGDEMSLKYAKKRQHFEPLIEMMQIKGNSEVHRNFWQADEFANFENADSIQNSSDRTFHKHDFVREGLKLGVAFEQSLGVNPFKYGFIGGTDNHNGLASDVEENRFIGGHGPEDGSVEARRTGDVSGWIDGKDLSIGSIAGVWAIENTRAALWDAMARRETFATSGPRIKIRMFGGNLPTNPTDPTTMVFQGYGLGVPMGGDLGPLDGAPSFTVYAEKDDIGANLDRIQIIKGWVDADGEIHERIINVTWSDGRVLGGDTLPPVGNTVDLTTAMFTNSIGAETLIGSWQDDDFDAGQHAFYYARVLEIPTPRWSTYDAVNNNMPLLDDVSPVIQERAWSSPIWYKP